MRILALVLPALLIQVGFAEVQSRDLGKSYYHFSLAKLHVINKDFSDAIAEFEKGDRFGSRESRTSNRVCWQPGEGSRNLAGHPGRTESG